MVWAAGWLSILALGAWLSQLLTAWLAVAAAGAALWGTAMLRGRDQLGVAVAVMLWITIGIAAGVQYRLWSVAERWPALHEEIEARAAERLNAALDHVVGRGERAVAEAAAIAGRGTRAGASAFARLEDARRATGMSSLAVLGPRRTPLLWSGEHRGAVPPAVWSAEQPYIFHQGPLFSRLYFTRPLSGGRVAVAAMLLESDLRAGEGVPFAERFATRRGLTPRFMAPDRAGCESVWDWSAEGPILSVCFEALTQANWWERVEGQARRGVGVVWLLTLLLLVLRWYRQARARPGIPVALATLALLVAPVGEMTGAQELFSPVEFVLPLPWDVTLGTVLLLLAGAAVWVLVRTADHRPGTLLPWWAPAGLSALVFIATVELVRNSAAVGLRASHSGGGFALQLATILALAIPLHLLMHFGARAGEARRSGLVLIATGFAAAVGLGVALVTLWDPAHPPPRWLVCAWAAPFSLICAALSRIPTKYAPLRAWVVAGVFASTVGLPSLWILHVDAKLQTAEIELSRLGTETDPFLDFLLRNFAERARYFDERREPDVDLLYHSWVASGLAREGYEAHLTIWERGRPEAELRLTDHPVIPAAVREEVLDAADTDREFLARYTEVEGLHYLLLVPLLGDRIVSVAVPPRSRLRRATALARFLESEGDRGATDLVESLYLVPMSDSAAASEDLGDGSDTGISAVSWMRTETGWRSEARAHFPSGWTHVHLFVRTATPALLLTRAVLVTTLLTALLLVMWACAQLICGRVTLPPALRPQWLRSVRARLTLALFAFFLLPTALFAVAAYEAVSREVVRSAAGVALRALDQTVTNLSRATLTSLSAEVGVDLLLYRRGALVDAAAPEALALGLFHTWLPPQIHLTFSSGEDLEDWEIRRLGENEHVVGYRRFNPVTVLAAPIPLASEEIQRRQTEFRDIALLLALLGAALSVVLSLLVGRALTRPIDELSRAALAIGGGNLRVQLPESRDDEFQPVYRSFNRMAKRLRRARSALERETRRTETIVAEAATGVLALDAGGRVELVNPRAEQILDASLAAGETLPRTNPLLAAVADAVVEFRGSAAAEHARELEIEGRIVRLRLRRLTPSGGPRGAVVALEDVTAEIRTARVLAWGEMARQVAHEIKNPLTPIKLAVQHLRRAFVDGRHDFGAILERNVEAILQEIDRLGEIARAFARFGTPAAATAELERVDVVRAVDETLALYRGAGEGIRYLAQTDSAHGLRAIGRMGELKEVLVNLLENAREAIHGEGRIVISVAPTRGGEWVEVTVADTGEGIPPELLPRIFDPHFSTRTSGTGLGLAIVRRMVESWGGEADADSEPGAGTRVRVRLRADRP